MKRLIVDLSSLMWTCLSAGYDDEFGQKIEHDGKMVQVNGWQYGYENSINSLLSAWEKNGIQPKDTILVYETGNSKGLRKRWLPTYKGDRDAGRPEQAYTEFNKLKEKLFAALTSVGATLVTRPNLEGDDVIAFLAQKLQGERIIMTGDRDLGVLLDDDVKLWRKNELVTENPYGPWPHQWMPVYKALVGDSSDKIPGAKGFGEKAWLDLICIFGADGIELMEQLIINKQLHKLEEDVADLKVLQKVIDNADQVYASYAAGKLYPEMCENMRVPLQWTPGYVKPRSEVEDERLRQFGGADRIVHAGNYDEALKFMQQKMAESDYVSLDLETHTSDESDDWIAGLGGKGVDVLDSRIVSMGVTFGANQQYNFYFTVNHREDAEHKNITMEQLKAAIETIPVEKEKVIANFAGFEAVVMRKNLGELSGHYFLPNAVDVQLEASYVNENIPRGLKSLTQHYLGVEQLDYETVTQGRKMNQMTAVETLAYGTGDTLFTSALHQHFNVIMELEGTLDAFRSTELEVQYVLAHAFLHGINFDFERMLEIEKEDLEEEAKAQAVLDEFLVKVGYEGTVCPVWTAEDLTVPAQIKSIYAHVLGRDLKTMVRTPSKIFALIASEDDEDARLLAKYLEDGNLAQLNDWTASRFEGKATLDLNSPKQVQNFLYRVCNMPVWLVNKVTDNERTNKPELAKAIYQFNRLQKGSKSVDPLTLEQLDLIKQKASTEAEAIEFALKYDADEELTPVLKAFQKLKEIGTRKSLFYGPWKPLLYWQDRKMHPSIKQSATTSRRFTASKPNVTQLGKEGEGVKLRSCYVPHKKGAIIVSLDFNAQELRAQASLSGDPEFLACYVGENKKDLHSITGASIANMSYEEFRELMHSDDPEVKKEYQDIRNKKGKPVNFLSSYGGTEVALHKKMIIPQTEAKVFLDAKKKVFPRYEEYQEELQEFAKRNGYVTCPLGSRRHVTDKVLSDESWEVDAAARSAGNFPIQGGCAGQTKRAMGAIWRSGVLERLDMRFYMPVHDEVVFSVVVEDAVEAIRVVHECMTQPFLLDVPSVSSISIGLNYADQHELGEEFDPEAITEKIQELLGEPVAA